MTDLYGKMLGCARSSLRERLFQPTACPDFGEAIFLARIASRKDCFVVPPRNDDFSLDLSMVAQRRIF